MSRPLVLVVGMLATKDRDGFLRNFTGLVRRVFGVPIHQDKGVPAAEIAAAARSRRHAGGRAPTASRTRSRRSAGSASIRRRAS